MHIAVCFFSPSVRFLQHFALSSVSQEPVLRGHLGALFPSAELSGWADRERDKVSVLILRVESVLSDGANRVRVCVCVRARVDHH